MIKFEIDGRRHVAVVAVIAEEHAAALRALTARRFDSMNWLDQKAFRDMAAENGWTAEAVVAGSLLGQMLANSPIDEIPQSLNKEDDLKEKEIKKRKK